MNWNYESFGQAAYETFATRTNCNEDPDWDALGEKERNAWIAAAKEVMALHAAAVLA